MKSFIAVFACVVFLIVGIAVGDAWRPTGAKAKYVLAEKSSLLLEATLDAQAKGGVSTQLLKRDVIDPMQSVIASYADSGYVVIDLTANDTGGYELVAVPKPYKNITAELKAAIANAQNKPQSNPSLANPKPQ